MQGERFSMGSFRFLGSLVLIGGLTSVVPTTACCILAQQTSGQSATVSRLVGSVVSVKGQSLTIKPDSGTPTTVTVADSARILQTTPGAKTIVGATPIHLTDLAVGDRVLVAVRAAADGSGPTATTVIAMREADIAKEHQAEEADWQRRGVGGIVKSVDATSGTVTIAHMNTTVTIHTTPKTVIRQYDPGSIKFSDTKVSTLDQIHVGDQLRARGDRSVDGAEMQAEEIVGGSFRNIAGSVASTDAAGNTLTVTDFKTKKPVVIRLNADSQLHKLDPGMAQALAARLKASGGSHEAGAQGNGRQSGEAAHASAAAMPSAAAQPASGQVSTEAGPGHHGGSVSEMLQRTPVIQLSDLHHGDAVMIVATQGAPGSLTACTLLAGVEPILSASPSAGQNLFSASWSLGGQGGGGGAGGGGGGAPSGGQQ
jgi:Cu/Ag efflux protein CusF